MLFRLVSTYFHTVIMTYGENMEILVSFVWIEGGPRRNLCVCRCEDVSKPQTLPEDQGITAGL